MAAVLHSFSGQQSPASEGTRPHRPFLLGVLFGGLAMGGLVAVASLGRVGAKFVAAPVGVASLDSGASFRSFQQPAQATGRATSPMMAADSQGKAPHRLPDAVIWDVDGTLVGSTSLAYGATNVVLQKHGFREVSEAEYEAATIYTTPERLALHATNDRLDPIGVTLGREFDSLYISQVSTSTAPLFDGIRELLQDIRGSGCRLGALSNAAGEYVRAVFAAHDLGGDFGTLLGADDVPAAKPSAAGLLEACAALKADPGACVYIGDGPNDGKAARAAGMRSIGCTWGSHGRAALEEHFDVIVDTVRDLRSEILERAPA